MPASAPTLRSLAHVLGLSRTTVSEALRGSPRVNPETARRVREAAAKAGYRHNPLAGAVMAEIRRSRTSMIRGALALIDLEEADRPAAAVSFRREIVKGATQRANELGFSADVFSVGEKGVSLRRLETILDNRGIHGVILLPTWRDPDFLQIDWARFAGVYVDYVIERPALHCVCCDHYRSMFIALQKLTALGYRRPAVVLGKHQDERLQHRWEGSFLGYQHNHAELAPIPALVEETLDREKFTAWFRKHKPDVVIGHSGEILSWMKEAGARVPETHGFVALNLHMISQPAAGLDLHPAMIGARAAEQVVAQLHRNERGVPAATTLTTIPGSWVDGPTVRAAK